MCRDTPGSESACLQEQYKLRGDASAAPSASTIGAAKRRAKLLLRPVWLRAVMPILFYMISPVLVLLMRVLVRRRAFWARGLRQAHFRPETVTDELLYRYRLPSLLRGWESGMLRFIRARMVRTGAEKAAGSEDLAGRKVETLVASGADSPTSRAERGQAGQLPAGPGSEASGRSGSSSSSNNVGAAEPPAADATLLQRFKAAVRERSVPVLLVHGEQDSLVPVSNSCRLSAVLRAPLIKIADCGHTPAEEVPDAFVDIVTRFTKDLSSRRRS